MSRPLSDRPIREIKDDELNRKVLAEYLANLFCAWEHNEEGVVVALYGSWGSGKTSTKNLMLRYLEQKDEDRRKNHANRIAQQEPLYDQPMFEILEFNPWWFSDFEQLSRHFFEEVGKKIALTDSTTQKQIARTWYTWTALFNPPAAFLAGAALINPTAAIGPIILLKLAAIVKAAGYFCSKVADLFKKHAEEVGDDIESQRARVHAQLKKLSRPVLIIVDDIDRLTADDIRLLFKVIKANSDFPNLGFLLLCQRELVEASLEETMPKKLGNIMPMGIMFLDKIVHIGLTLPAPRPHRIKELLKKGLKDNLHVTVPEWELDQAIGLIVGGIKTVRHIRRFCEGFNLQRVLFITEQQATIWPLDLLLMEYLRIFEPTVFESIEVDGWRLASLHEGNEIRLAIRNNQLHYKRDLIDKILLYLFPNSTAANASSEPASKQDRDRARLHLQQNMENYFSLIQNISITTQSVFHTVGTVKLEVQAQPPPETKG